MLSTFLVGRYYYYAVFCRLAELADQVLQKSRDLVTTKAQLECVEVDKLDLKQRVESLNQQKTSLEHLLQSDKHGVVS